MPVVIRTAYDGIRVGSDDLVTPKDAVGAKQSFKAECDINNIVKSFSQTGEFTHLNMGSPVFADLSSVSSFHEMMDLVADAQESFDQLPADVRKRFGNDPREFVDFVQDPANKGELVRMGLAVEADVVSAVKPPEPPPSGGTIAAPGAPGAIVEGSAAVPGK